MALFLFLTTLGLSGAIYNEGLVQEIDQNGFKPTVEKIWDERDSSVVSQSVYNVRYNQ